MKPTWNGASTRIFMYWERLHVVYNVGERYCFLNNTVSMILIKRYIHVGKTEMFTSKSVTLIHVWINIYTDPGGCSKNNCTDLVSGIILCVRPANEILRYIVTSSLIGWAHIQNDPWMFVCKCTRNFTLIVSIKIWFTTYFCVATTWSRM